MASGVVETNDSKKISGVVMIFPATDSLSPSSGPPRRLRGRLVDSKIPSTAEEIDAKLKEADHRRQQFYEDLSSKARQKQRILLSYSRESELDQRLQPKLRAAEQKRLSILTIDQMRLLPDGNLKETIDQAEALPTKLVRYWRRFVRLRGTTYELTKAFASLNINGKSVKQLPFEQLALKIGSDTALKAGRSLLERLETRLLTQYAVSNGSNRRAQVESIDHLLNRVASGSQNKAVKILCRYQVRILLCSYMMLGHPDAVLSRKGENETALADSAAELIQEFELLVEIILGGSDAAINSVSFRQQLEEFDKAWCTYLYHFVVWKTKDAESLEHDLVKAACQLELSMMRSCKMTPGGQRGGLKLIQKQVIENQRLLKAKVKNLTGETGVKRMEFALSDTRSKFFAPKETISPLPSEDKQFCWQ